MLRRLFRTLLLQNQIKNATRLTTATPPITPPATATVVEPLPLPLLPLLGIATTVVVDPDDCDCVEVAARPDAIPIVVKGVAVVAWVWATSL